MKRKLILFVTILLVFATLFAVPASSLWLYLYNNNSAPKEYAYSFAFVGDTQIISTLDADTEETISSWGFNVEGHIGKKYMAGIYDWIVENKDEKKIAHVFGLGDITQNRKSGVPEWEAAKDAWSRLDGKVSYSLVRGNHDDMTLFSRYLNYDAYLNQFDGRFVMGDNGTKSNYKFLDVGQEKWLLIALDFGAADNVLAWAEKIIKDNPDRRVIITTHGYLHDNGARRTSREMGDWLSASDGGYNYGEDIWNKLVRKHENIFMVVCGHMWTNPFAFRTVKGDNGNTVYEIMFNPQDHEVQRGPAGMVGMMYFSEDGSTFWMEYYSTVKKQYVKLNPSKVVFDESKLTTTAPQTTVAPEPETSAPEVTSAESEITKADALTTLPVLDTDPNYSEQTMPEETDVLYEDKGCASVYLIPALPISLGVTSLVARNKKKK